MNLTSDGPNCRTRFIIQKANAGYIARVFDVIKSKSAYSKSPATGRGGGRLALRESRPTWTT